MSAVVSRLHSSGTASSRAKTADKSSGNNGGNTSPQEKTASMLKNTLRKMTRFSIGSSNAGRKKEQAEDSNFAKPAVPPETDKSRSRTTFLGKSRVPKSQSPGPGVSRSKSFKEPGAPVTRTGAGGGSVTNGNGLGSNYNSLARNNVYTSSLRRTKMKHKVNEDNDDKDNSTRPPSNLILFPNFINLNQSLKLSP